MNPRLATIEPSLIRALAAKRRPTSIDLGLGEPTLLPQQRFIEAAAQWAGEHGLKYTVNAGDPVLRERIAAHYAFPGMAAARNVCVMTGSQEGAYATVKAMLDPARDALLVVEPAYPAYAKMAQLEGVAVQRVGMTAANGFGYDIDAILAAITPATRMIVIASPANPTGRVISRAATKRLADALLARAGAPIWVLQDELYRELTYVEDAGSIAHHYPSTIVLNGVSKSNALTGLRIGWTIAPATAIDEITKAHTWLTSAASAFGQRVTLGIFSEPGALAEHALWYRAQCAEVLVALRESGLEFVAPEGAFYACVRLPNATDSVAAAHRLIDDFDVVAIPGRIFGDTLEGWLRLSWVAPIASVREGLSRIAHAALV